MTSAPTPVPRVPDAAGSHLEVGAILAERYRILGELGAGRMGKVYLAEHQLLRKKLAIKVLHRDLAGMPDIVARFEREAMAAGNIGHPNVAAATDFGRLPDGSMFLALEFVDGRTLRAELQQPLGVARALNIALQIGSALAAAHELGIVHRDLKPENVMLVERGEDRDLVKVLDFGIARFSDPAGRFVSGAPLTLPSTVFGTPEYMAPEQALGQPVDGRADLFALGVMLFEMLAGVRPYDAPNLGGVLGQQLAGPPPSLSAKRPTLRSFPALDGLLSSLLARRASERPASTAAVVRALEACLGDSNQDFAAAKAPAAASREAPRQLPTFLPGDPLPSFALPADGESAAVGPAPLPAAAPADAPDAPTLFVAPRASVPAPPLAAEGEAAPASASPSSGNSASSGSAPSGSAPSGSAPSGSAPSGSAPSSSAPSSSAPSGAVAVRATLLSGVVRGVLDAVRALRRRWPRALERRLRRVPDEALLVSLAALAVVGLLVVVLFALRGGGSKPSAVLAASAPAVTPSAKAPPPPEVVPVASAATANDTNAELDAARADAAAGRDAAALAAVARALTQHPSLRDDERVAAVLYRTAGAADKKVADTSFALLQGTMAARGAEILYRIMLDKSVPEPTRRAAERWLRSDQAKAALSSDLQLSLKLRFTASCPDRRELLPLAAKGGKKLTLDVLREFSHERGCGFSGQEDCYPCLRGDSRLGDAVAAIEKRVGG